MARSFHHTLLAAVAALVVAGSATAQDTLLKEAATAIRLGKPEEAKAKLREILTADPSSAEALQLYQSISQDEWYMLITDGDGDIRQVAQSILARAKAERQEQSRDESAIQGLVDAATAGDSDYGARQDAINKLIAQHGEFAVPALVAKLANADDNEGQIFAISALSQLHSAAVLPLIEALKSSDELTVQNVAAALHHIGDMRAAPAMANLANDSRVAVASIARSFLAKHKVTGNGVDLLLAQAKRYLQGDIPAGGFSGVVWSLVDDKLMAVDVPAVVYPAELAKACASDAVAIAPQNAAAVSMLAQANLAEANLIETSIAQGDESVQGLADVVADLKIAAQATGLPALRAALDAGIRDGMAPVAVAAIDALAQNEGADTVNQSSLIRALDSSDKRIAYAAAAALVRASNGVNVPESNKVVQVLADAVTQEDVRTIQVISPDSEAASAAAACAGTRGKIADASSSAKAGMLDILNDPSIDVVVINEILPDGLPEDIIGNIKKDSRMANMRIVIVAKDVDAATERFGDSVHGVVQAPLTGEALVAEVNRVLEGVSSPAGARAEGYAAQASAALLKVAAGKGSVAAALGNLGLQLNGRSDAIAVPAAETLGIAGDASQIDALVGALQSGSDALKVASADALGRILQRSGTCPEGAFAALEEAVKGGGAVELRLAAAIALGKAKLDATQRAAVQSKLHRIAGASSDG
ncbi:MAG: HEAT repeat domain-containing protein [Planctomycetes bacterium]|nr:HEAT repeat domain-containing protein [Planctomycetota bacterium]